ncbi:MAG: hypothetical protein CL464_03180 [Acidimicrobiaceae bacterium]|nr:hypothetical protein [Acidimicrobiaceae bacterium]
MLPLYVVAALLDNRTEDDKRQCGRLAVTSVTADRTTQSCQVTHDRDTNIRSVVGWLANQRCCINSSQLLRQGVFPPR